MKMEIWRDCSERGVGTSPSPLGYPSLLPPNRPSSSHTIYLQKRLPPPTYRRQPQYIHSYPIIDLLPHLSAPLLQLILPLAYLKHIFLFLNHCLAWLLSLGLVLLVLFFLFVCAKLAGHLFLRGLLFRVGMIKSITIFFCVSVVLHATIYCFCTCYIIGMGIWEIRRFLLILALLGILLSEIESWGRGNVEVGDWLL